MSESLGWTYPHFDFAKLLAPYNIQGVDTQLLVTREAKSIESFLSANRIAYEGWQSLMHRQMEIFQETMHAVAEEANRENSIERRMELTHEGFKNGLSNMQELAEILVESQKHAYKVVMDRFIESMSRGFQR